MFLGHFALGLAAKKVEPEVSLATAFVASQLPDVLWPALLLAGRERVAITPGDTAVTPLRFESYPYSHSLIAVLLWSAAFGLLHFWKRRRVRRALLLGGLVISHFVLDLATHRPDLPLLLSGGPKVGLGLWHSVPATLAFELLLFFGGLAHYLGTTGARDRIGLYGLAALVGFLLVVYFANVFGPPPPSVQAIGLAGLLGAALLVAWAGWVDRHREPSRAGQ